MLSTEPSLVSYFRSRVFVSLLFLRVSFFLSISFDRALLTSCVGRARPVQYDCDRADVATPEPGALVDLYQGRRATAHELSVTNHALFGCCSGQF